MSPSVPQHIKDKSKVTKEEWREYTKTVWHIANTVHDEHPAVFPLEIPRRLTKLFSFHGERVLDPFAGTGVTAKAALELGREAVCIEQNQAYTQIMERELSVQSNKSGASPSSLEIIHGDSRAMPLASDSIDLIVTSPPYWNKADYGAGDANLGNTDGYTDFFDRIRPAFDEGFRVLKPGRKYCLVTANVNQYTDHGLLTFPLAADFTCLLRDIGFVLISEVVWSKDGTGGRWGSWGAQRPIFGSYPYPPNFLFKNVHEYILIFAKPPRKKINKEKALPYAQLMEEPSPNGDG